MEKTRPPRTRRRGSLKLWVPALLIIPAAVLAAPWLIGPECPTRVVIYTGSRDGAYFAFAQKYREILAEDGITLEIRTTAGSVENGKQLCDEDSDALLAIMQGGTGSKQSVQNVETLAGLYREPVWVFSRKSAQVKQLADLKGKRVAVGAPGSGTRAVAVQLLAENNITAEARPRTETTLLPFAGSRAAEALKRGEIDAAILVISPQSPLIRGLLESPDVSLMSFRRAAAYQKKFPFLTSVTLSEGVIDLKKNLPARDIVLLAPTANLVARKGLHPALIPLMMKAVARVHESGGILESAGEFPTAKHVEFAMNDDAKRYLTTGPSFLFRYLPFGLAVWLDRVKLMLLPLCTLLIPLFKLAPPLYRWKTRSKIHRLYDVLREIDASIRKENTPSVVETAINRLQELEAEIAAVTVPLSYMQEFYHLRLHASFLHERLKGKQAEQEKPKRAAA